MIILLPEVIARYFLSITIKEKTNFVQYDPLGMNAAIKARVQEMGAIKKRFLKVEVEAILSTWYSVEEMEGIILKNFRKVGK